MSVPVKQCTFAGGEITPAAIARSDLSLYEKSARILRNMISMKHGGATGRPGTMYVGTTLNGGNPVRLIPFIFNETGVGQSYVLEFGNLYIAFYQNGGVVISAPSTPYTIVSPYAQADLQNLQFAQCADIVTITNQNYPVYELKRLAATNWTITPSPFIPQGAVTSNYSLSGSVGTPIPWANYTITAITATGEELGSGLQTGPAGGNLALPTATTPITINWDAAAGASSYRVFFSTIQGSPGNYKQSGWGYIGTTIQTSFVDTGITPDYSQAPPIGITPFQNINDYPATVGFVQQRRAFANTVNNPIGFWFSQPGDFYNYESHVIQQDSDAIIASMAGEEVNSIQHILELKFLLMLTTGAEIYVQGNGSGVVTPSAINASVQSQYGCAPIRPLKCGDVLIFAQALGSKIRDFAFDFTIDGYRGNDISIFATHLFEGYQIVDWCFQKEPDSIIWAVRSDGVLLTCTYIREQQVLAWTHHDMTNGFVDNVCAIPENGYYSVYASVKRVINGSTVRYIERVSQRIWQGPSAAVAAGTANSLDDPIDAPFCDCYAQYDGRNTGSTTMTLTASGSFQTDSTAYQQSLTLTSSIPYFGSGQTAQIGDEIYLQDALWISSQWSKGNQVRCVIQSIQSSTVCTVTPSGAVPTEFQGVPVTIWARAVQIVSGLGFLVGQKVSVWADRFVVGSPLNSHVETVYTVPSSGVLTLDKPYSVIYVGLPMVQDVEPLPLETYFGETMLGRRKRMSGLYGFIYNTRSFYAGSENPDTNDQNTSGDALFQLFPIKTGISQATYDQPPPLLTTQDYVITNARWNKFGSIFMRNVDPVPWTLLAVSPHAENPVQTPYVRV